MTQFLNSSKRTVEFKAFRYEICYVMRNVETGVNLIRPCAEF